MLPPVESATLSSCPKFTALYQDLCNRKLNPDGSSKLDDKTQEERNTLSEELRKLRVEQTKRDLIVNGLWNLSGESEVLPHELRELVAIIAATVLSRRELSGDERDLLHNDTSKFEEIIEPISKALTLHFQHSAHLLSSLLPPTDNSSQPSPKTLPSTVLQLQTHLRSTDHLTNRAHLDTLSTTTTLATLHNRILETSIRLLEQTLHGSVSRGTRAKADYLALVAEGMGKKLGLQAAQLEGLVYSAVVRELVERKLGEGRAEMGRIRREIREGEERLEGLRGMGLERVAAEYGEVVAETERVRAEIVRLRGG